MRGFAILLVLAGVGYLVYTQGLPKLEERRQADASQAAEAAEAERARSCIYQAREASRSFGRDVRQFGRPPIDQGLWASFMTRLLAEASPARPPALGG